MHNKEEMRRRTKKFAGRAVRFFISLEKRHELYQLRKGCGLYLLR
jgi:hypothetical protein